MSRFNLQLDMPLNHHHFRNVPRTAVGRLGGQDFVHFKYPCGINPERYTVVVESLDVSGCRFRSISKLCPNVELPHVKFDPHGRIGVLPDSPYLPSFEAEIVRGGTYIIPSVKGTGVFQMEQHGKV